MINMDGTTRAIRMHNVPSAKLQRHAAVVLVFAACAALLATSPVDGDFGWQDAPRHAMNGIFVHDLLSALPWRDPVGWAMAYYARYPALTILFYPPLVPFVQALVFFVLGVSHWSAQLAVWLFVPLLAFSAFALARLLVPLWTAAGFAILVIGAPEIAYWARQVMTDIAAMALIALGLLLLLRHCRTGRLPWLAFAAAAFAGAIWCKFTAVFVLPCVIAVLVWHRGWSVLWQRGVLWIALASALAVAPAAYLAVMFSAINLESVSGRANDAGRFSPDGLLFYVRALPGQVGWPALAVSLAGVVLVLLRPRAQTAWLAVVLVCWTLLGWAFFTMIGVREPRHDLMILLPLLLCVPVALHRALPRWSGAASLLLGVGTLGWSLAFYPVITLGGFREVADMAAQAVPRGSVIVFSGYRDANFTFEIRERWHDRDLTVLRSDKLLLSIAVERERGVKQTDHDEAAIAAMLRGHGVALVVHQRGFFEDLRQMARFGRVLESADFVREGSFFMGGRGEKDAAYIDIYRPTYEVDRSLPRIEVDLPIIGRRISVPAPGT